MGRHVEEYQLCHELAASLTSAHEEAASLHRQARLDAQMRLEAAGNAEGTVGPHAGHHTCEVFSQTLQNMLRSEMDVDGATQHESMRRELHTAGARIPPKVLHAVSSFAAQSNTGFAWPYIRDLLLIIDQAYWQQAQSDLDAALEQQHMEVQRLTRRKVNAEPAAWVLQRQRVAHLERQLRTCTCKARCRLAERSGRDMLHFAVDKAFYLSQEVDSLARENAKLREHGCEKVVTAPLASSTAAKRDFFLSQQGASDTAVVSSGAAESTQKISTATQVVHTSLQAGENEFLEPMDDLDMPERHQSSGWYYLTSTCTPARQEKDTKTRPTKHGLEAPDELLDTAILEWQSLCESLSADVSRSK